MFIDSHMALTIELEWIYAWPGESLYCCSLSCLGFMICQPPTGLHSTMAGSGSYRLIHCKSLGCRAERGLLLAPLSPAPPTEDFWLGLMLRINSGTFCLERLCSTIKPTPCSLHSHMQCSLFNISSLYTFINWHMQRTHAVPAFLGICHARLVVGSTNHTFESVLDFKSSSITKRKVKNRGRLGLLKLPC